MSVVTVLIACGMRRRVPAEEQSDDEDRTSLVPDRRENEKDRVNVPTACGIETHQILLVHLRSLLLVATVLTTCGMIN